MNRSAIAACLIDLKTNPETGHLLIFGCDCPAWCLGSIPVMLVGAIAALCGWGS